MDQRSPFDNLGTSARYGRSNRGWIRVWLYLGIVAMVLFAGYHTLKPSKATQSASTPSACQESACDSAPERKSAQGSAMPSSAPLPCPYCNQNPDRWMTQTSTAPPEIGGKALAVIEGSCGQLLYGVNQNEHFPPASLTKIVTALVTVDSAKLADRVPISINGWDLSAEDDSSIMGLEAGMNLSVEELLYGLLLPSGNDAALALADHTGGEKKFVERMNQRVQKMGLRNTHFANPDGRDAIDHYSSALDMALLGRELMNNPSLRKIAGSQTFTPNWSGRMLWNASYFIYNYPGATGVKIGYTDQANYTIVSSAVRDGREVFVSVMNSVFFFSDSKKLLDWAFDNTKPNCPS